MADEGSVTGWLHDLKDGDVQAVERLWQRYYSILVNQAQRRMGGRTRIHDGEDVVEGREDPEEEEGGRGPVPAIGAAARSRRGQEKEGRLPTAGN